MNLEQAAYLAQIIGTIVVVLTLIYLSIQVRQGTELLRSESRQSLHANDMSGVYKFVEYPELSRLFSQAETPTLEEKTRLMFWIIGQMRTREHEWLQYKSGALDEETWMSSRDVTYFVLGTERARALWALCSPYFNQQFTAMVARMIDAVPPSDFWERLEAVN
jgi:hypothetical protein